MERGIIAYCIPTYNHPDVIKETLENEVILFQKYNIDVYVYDSSEEDATEVIVNDFVRRGYDNIYYIRVSSDEKGILMLSGYGLKKHYDYIWPVKDREYFLERTIKVVLEAAACGYNAIFLTKRTLRWELKQEGDTRDIFEEPILFFREWAWLATSLDATLFHYDSMLQDIDVEKFKEKYFVNGQCSFVHFISLFVGLAALKKPRVRIIREEDVVAGCQASVASSWRKETFEVWGYLWPKAVNSLPSCYDLYKNFVIKQQTMVPMLFGSQQNLIYYKNTGVLTREIFEKHRKQWHELSDIPLEEVDLVLEEKIDELGNKIVARFKNMILEGRYEQAYILFYRNKGIMEAYLRKYDYHILESCFLIYEKELDRGIDSSVFYGVCNMEQIIKKYQNVKYFLRRIEFEISEHEQYQLFSTVLKQGLTDDFLSHVIQKDCIYEKRIAASLENFVNRYLEQV